MTRDELKSIIDESGIDLNDIPGMTAEIKRQRLEKEAAKRVEQEKKTRQMLAAKEDAVEALTNYIKAVLALDGVSVTRDQERMLNSTHRALLGRLTDSVKISEPAVTAALKRFMSNDNDEDDDAKLTKFISRL